MGLGCGATMVKYLLFLMNFIFFVTGAAILGISIWIQVDPSASDYLSIIGEADDNPALEIALYILIAVGVFIFLVGFLGCCGACKESSCMLCTYAFLVGMVLVLQIAAAVVAIIFKSDLDTELESGMSEQANQHVTDDIDIATTAAWYRMQFDLKCCGGKDFTDYKNSTFNRGAGTKYVPLTCCVRKAGAKWDDADPAENSAACLLEAQGYVLNPDEDHYKQLYAHGCYSGLKDWIGDKSNIVIGVAFGLGAFQILCIIFACCVRGAVKERDGYS